MNAVISWKDEKLVIQTKGQKISIPLTFTRNLIPSNLNKEEDSDETEDKEEYEEEDLLEAEGYYSEESDSENEVDWLGFNPWVIEETSEYEQYLA